MKRFPTPLQVDFPLVWKIFQLMKISSGLQSYVGFDPFPFLSIIDGPITFVGKIELLKAPFLGPTMQAIEALPMERENCVNH